jgi:hypothetical protein
MPFIVIEMAYLETSTLEKNKIHPPSFNFSYQKDVKQLNFFILTILTIKF